MSIIVMIIAILVGAFENMKDSHDVQKWRNSGGMESRYNCWKKNNLRKFYYEPTFL